MARSSVRRSNAAGGLVRLARASAVAQSTARPSEGWQGLLALLLGGCVGACGAGVGEALLAIDGAPAGLDQHLPAAAEEVLADAGLDDGALKLGRAVEDGQEAARHEVVEAALVAIEPAEVLLARWSG